MSTLHRVVFGQSTSSIHTHVRSITDPDMLELGAPVVGPYASRPDPAHPTGRHSTCGAGDGTVGDTAPRLTLEQGMAQFAAWCTVSSPLILGFDLANETE